ncbi:alpha/beta fold hydrolase [Streptomyces sp. ML-6]|nr:alpha/beta fold hydrolase [Streptomyces sp. ML-6]MDK0523927.1 alpha/beta fold hydrolase [Streptomyces sp. ML-6]
MAVRGCAAACAGLARAGAGDLAGGAARRGVFLGGLPAAARPRPGPADPGGRGRRCRAPAGGRAGPRGHRATATHRGRPRAPTPAPAVVPPAPAATRASLLAAYLTDKAAETLRIPAKKIDPGTSFASYGMDSILVLQFANALREDLGELSSALLFEEDSVDRLSAYLLEHQRAEVDALTGARLPDSGKDANPDAVRGPSAASIGSLFTTLAGSGDPALSSSLLTAAARLRPAFASGADGREPETLHLADGADGIGLVCLPSLVAPTGAHQYLRFALALRGLRSVWTAGVPGYGAGEPLPGTLDAAMDLQADFLQRRFAGRLFALVAYSSGGWAAHEVLRRLEAAGAAPVALVLLDSPGRPDDDVAGGMATIAHWLTSRFPQLPVEDEQLTAMARYAELFDGWRPRPVSTPTLFVGAASEGPLFEVLGDRSGPLWRPEWPLEHTRLEVPGSHFTILDEHAKSTALAVHQWLVQRSG